jgi:hypothetical protein
MSLGANYCQRTSQENFTRELPIQLKAHGINYRFVFKVMRQKSLWDTDWETKTGMFATLLIPISIPLRGLG